jgi:hypothetical protein
VAVLQEYALVEKAGKYGCIEHNRLDDVVQVMYKNFSSLGLFTKGPTRHKKVRQLNKLMADYGVDVLVGCETWTDWQFIKKEDNRFCNLFGSRQPTCGSQASNINNHKIKRDQWGGTCVTASGRSASFVALTGADTTGLGRWSWIYVGGGGKSTRVIVVYQPCSPKNRRTMGEPVWDQHLCYFKSRGESWDPRSMFHHNLISLLRQWKGAGDEIMQLGDFNENVYLGPIACSLSLEELPMGKTCQRTTETMLPANHSRGHNPIDAVFCTAGLVCTAVTLLPSRVGVGDHRVFVLDFASEIILGNVFPWVIQFSRRLLNCASDKIRNNYITVLNQLSNRHLMFKKMLHINRASNHLSPAIVQLCMNKVDMKLEQFMKLVEMDSHKYKCSNIEWSPYSSVWIH